MSGLAAMPRYEVYKDSGVARLGNIPKHWEIKKIKHLARINNGLDYKSVESESGYPVYGSGGVFAYANTYLYDGEAILLGRKGTIDKPLYVNGKFWTVDTMFCAICRNKEDTKFIYYLSTTIPFSYYSTSTALPSMTQFDLNNHVIAYPPAKERRLIIAFLDAKTTQIDQAIATKQKQIELLKERRQILIQNAVTRGLNPDAPTRNSGVEWIGEIPVHWEVKRLKYVLDERSDRSKTGEEPLFMMSQVHGLVVRSEFHEKAEVAQSNVDNKLVYKHDLVFNKLKAHLGVFFKSNIEFVGSVSPDYAVYKSKGVITDLKYLELLFRHPAYIGQFVIRATGIVEGLTRLYTSDLFNIAMAIPPKTEQLSILAFVEKESEKFNKAIALQEQQIDRLKEYRATMINSVVTGKVKVV